MDDVDGGAPPPSTEPGLTAVPRFNPPPGWPPPPPGWQPPAGWRPDPSWPPAPPGWVFWDDDASVGAARVAGPPVVTPPTAEPTVLLRKVANLLVEDAQLDLPPALGVALDVVDVDTTPAEVVIDVFRAAYGGLWVGGTLIVTDRTVDFRANGMNRAVQSGTLDLSVQLRHVAAVEVLPGVVTRIVAMRVGGRVVKARTYGADRVAETLRQAIARARS
ncbi:MAG: hypothetical protein J0H73_16270 [Salana multivorans]|uniref:hypothetical protein n=1 Tax=Salana multivorans TaxID=120377 RepID=UPI000962886B|nr:hypothetical protein [Salana multivorans]MBN8883853.1 hypothetical protein [Salana multivorans]OJX94610.1 MAG: hypothetical protein BGO96_00500 [Micrococcales bacterium 73-15]